MSVASRLNDWVAWWKACVQPLSRQKQNYWPLPISWELSLVRIEGLAGAGLDAVRGSHGWHEFYEKGLARAGAGRWPI